MCVCVFGRETQNTHQSAPAASVSQRGGRGGTSRGRECRVRGGWISTPTCGISVVARILVVAVWNASGQSNHDGVCSLRTPSPATPTVSHCSGTDGRPLGDEHTRHNHRRFYGFRWILACGPSMDEFQPVHRKPKGISHGTHLRGTEADG